MSTKTLTSASVRIFVVRERCKGCGFCVEFCPKDILKMAEEFNSKGYHVPVVVKEYECSSCKMCELLCPELAIYTHKPTDQPPREHTSEAVR
jgi:2-oxoglutarate ferredoxin oxidoreductase subunit delta